MLSFLSCPLPDLEPCPPSQLAWCICLLSVSLSHSYHICHPLLRRFRGWDREKEKVVKTQGWSGGYPSSCSGNHRTPYPHFLRIALCGWKSRSECLIWSRTERFSGTFLGKTLQTVLFLLSQEGAIQETKQNISRHHQPPATPATNHKPPPATCHPNHQPPAPASHQ